MMLLSASAYGNGHTVLHVKLGKVWHKMLLELFAVTANDILWCRSGNGALRRSYQRISASSRLSTFKHNVHVCSFVHVLETYSYVLKDLVVFKIE